MIEEFLDKAQVLGYAVRIGPGIEETLDGNPAARVTVHGYSIMVREIGRRCNREWIEIDYSKRPVLDQLREMSQARMDARAEEEALAKAYAERREREEREQAEILARETGKSEWERIQEKEAKS